MLYRHNHVLGVFRLVRDNGVGSAFFVKLREVGADFHKTTESSREVEYSWIEMREVR